MYLRTESYSVEIAELYSWSAKPCIITLNASTIQMLEKAALVHPHIDLKPVKNYTLSLYEMVIADINGIEIEHFTFRGDAKPSK